MPTDLQPIDQRFADALLKAMTAGAVPVCGHPPIWREMTPTTEYGWVVALREHAGDPELFWCGPPAPDSRVCWLRRPGPAGALLVPTDPPVAVFTTADAARAVYRAYLDLCATRHRPPPARSRPVPISLALHLPTTPVFGLPPARTP